MKKIPLIFFFLFHCFFISAENDSLLKILNSADSPEKCNQLLAISKSIRSAKIDSAIFLSNLSVEIAKKLKDTSLIIKSYFAIADNYYWGLSDFPKTKMELDTLANFYFENLTNAEKARFYSQLGDVVYFDKDLVRSMENYYKALEFAGTDSFTLARLYHNLGWVYADLGKHDKAIYYGQLGLHVSELSKGDVVHKMDGLVYIYETAKMFDKALEYIRKVEKLTNKNPQYYSYQKASLYILKGDTHTAIKNYKQGTEFAKKNNSVKWLMNNLYYTARNLIMTGKKNEAIPYFKEYENLIFQYNKEYEISALYSLLGETYLSLSMMDSSKFFLDKAEKIQSKYNQPELGKTFKILSQWFFFNGKIKESRAYLLNYIEHSDRLKKQEDKIAAKAKDDMLKMYELENSIFTKDAEISKRNLQLEKEKFQKYGFLTGLVLVLLLVIYVYKNLHDRKKSNQTLSEKNLLIENQKEEVESKNKEILDSIHYAKRIQQAILKEEEYISEHLPPHFILFKPKDIVSGDFHWILEKQNHLYLAVADCTGHGVPGAFMSMLGISFLNEICSSEKILPPSEILNILREKIIKELNQKGTVGTSKDGMDISLISLELNNEMITKLQYSGANNPLIVIRKNQVIEFKADKQPIGYFPVMKPFTNHEISLEKNDVLYLFSDGYSDQFGGLKGKKFKYRKMEELFLKIHREEMKKQKEILGDALDSWKGNNEQTDDICVIGVRVLA